MNISLKNISFSYSDSLDDAILKNLNLEIRSGECVVLAGESGCGKTTISKLINGLILPFGNDGWRCAARRQEYLRYDAC